MSDQQAHGTGFEDCLREIELSMRVADDTEKALEELRQSRSDRDRPGSGGESSGVGR
jgi:hypothetical protein